MEMYIIIFGNVKELMYTTTSRDNYGNMYVWKCQRMNIHCNIKRQLWKYIYIYICLEISKNRCTLLFQEITMEMYMFGNIKKGRSEMCVWKYQRMELHYNFKRQLWKHQRTDVHHTVSSDNCTMHGNIQVWK